MGGMGCDIHLLIEQAQNGRWVYVPAPTDPDWPDFRDTWFNDRNYDLFGALAGVRLRHRAQLTDLRGLPLDVTKEVAKESESWAEDGHSHTWYLLSELLAQDWDGVSGRWTDFLRELTDRDVPTALRLVMWFDN